MTWKRSNFKENNIWHTFKVEEELNGDIQEFMIQDLPEERHKEALKFMLDNFLSDEPICKSKNVLNNNVALKEICELWENVLDQKCTLACIRKDNLELVGLNMLCVITKEDFANFKLIVRKDNTWKAVHDFALANFNLFERYNFADKILIAYGLSVSKQYRKKGIATEILRSRIPLCKALNIPLTSTVFTALGSQKPAEKIGFKVDYEITYKELGRLYEAFDFEDLGTSTLKVMSLVID